MCGKSTGLAVLGSPSSSASIACWNMTCSTKSPARAKTSLISSTISTSYDILAVGQPINSSGRFFALLRYHAFEIQNLRTAAHESDESDLTSTAHKLITSGPATRRARGWGPQVNDGREPWRSCSDGSSLRGPRVRTSMLWLMSGCMYDDSFCSVKIRDITIYTVQYELRILIFHSLVHFE